MSTEGNVRVMTTHRLLEMKQSGEKIAMLTAYDYTSARILDEAGIDIILVGDSAANVMAGHETTLPITIDQMIYHAQSVMRAVKNPLVVVDMPFGSYQGNSKMAVSNAADAVKIEGGMEILESVERILSSGIPVMGHLGLTPQSIHKFGTYAVRAKEEAEAAKLLQDAIALEDAGCFALVLEKIPAALGKKVAETLKIPVIGIGAGKYRDPEDTGNRHRRGQIRGRTGARDARHARADHQVLSQVPAPLRRPARCQSQCIPPVYRGCQIL